MDLSWWNWPVKKLNVSLSFCSRTKRNTLTSSTATWRSTAPCTAPAPCTSRATSRTTASWAAGTCNSSSEKPRWVCVAVNVLKKMTLRGNKSVSVRCLLDSYESHKPTPTLFPLTFFKWPRNCGPANLQNIEDTLYHFHKPWPFFMCRGCETCSEHSCNSVWDVAFFEWSQQFPKRNWKKQNCSHITDLQKIMLGYLIRHPLCIMWKKLAKLDPQCLNTKTAQLQL